MNAKGEEEEPDVGYETEEADDMSCDDAWRSLPSPKESPKKKPRKGMNEVQIIHARDLCGTAHAVLKLLSILFTMPAVYSLFTSTSLIR